MLRQATLEDIPFLYHLYMHNDVNRYLLYERMDKEEFNPIIKRLIEDGQKFVFIRNEIPVGMAKIYQLTFRCSHICYLGGFAIEPAHSGKGYATQMLREIVNHCWGIKDIKRIELSVADSNFAAQAVYRKLGFEVEGRLREYGYLASENRYVDEFIMSLIKKELSP